MEHGARTLTQARFEKMILEMLVETEIESSMVNVYFEMSLSKRNLRADHQGFRFALISTSISYLLHIILSPFTVTADQ